MPISFDRIDSLIKIILYYEKSIKNLKEYSRIQSLRAKDAPALALTSITQAIEDLSLPRDLFMVYAEQMASYKLARSRANKRIKKAREEKEAGTLKLFDLEPQESELKPAPATKSKPKPKPAPAPKTSELKESAYGFIPDEPPVITQDLEDYDPEDDIFK